MEPTEDDRKRDLAADLLWIKSHETVWRYNCGRAKEYLDAHPSGTGFPELLAELPFVAAAALRRAMAAEQDNARLRFLLADALEVLTDECVSARIRRHLESGEG